MAPATGEELSGIDERTSLSSREVEILTLLANGSSSKEVASALYLSKRTVDFHLGNAYQKLGVGNRVQAILAIGRMNLVPDEPAFEYVAKVVDDICAEAR